MTPAEYLVRVLAPVEEACGLTAPGVPPSPVPAGHPEPGSGSLAGAGAVVPFPQRSFLSGVKCW